MNMNMNMSLSCSTVLALAAAALAVLYTTLEAPASCPHDPESCFFSEAYAPARARFREAAALAGATLHQLNITADLTIDVAVIPGNAATPPTLVHMSGTHGVEAHAGSAVQLALLKRWADAPADAPSSRGVRVVLVHAVNPHGFHCGRRWNEQGVRTGTAALMRPM